MDLFLLNSAYSKEIKVADENVLRFSDMASGVNSETAH